MILKQIYSLLIKSLLTGGFLILMSCGEDYVPKPKAQLRLEYPDARYAEDDLELPFSFEINELAKKVESKKVKAS
ncbi:MAG: hypothetical protein IZT56_11365, partial [Bacteroidetes bacterium]|nr:hypothetical protein [Bacteroidota bacterium]